MVTTPNFDIAELFTNPEYYTIFRWVEGQVTERYPDGLIYHNFTAYKPDWEEEDIIFVEWALYYFELIGKRVDLVYPSIEDAEENEEDEEDEDEEDEE